MRRKGRAKTAVKVVILMMALVCVCAPLLSPLGFGSDVFTKQQDYDKLRSNIIKSERELSEGQKQAKELQADIRNYETQIYDTQVEINSLTEDLNATKERVTKTLAELDEIQGKITEQNEALWSRLRVMYMQGDAGMISILLGSASMTELLTNVEMMKRITESDSDLIASLEKQHAAVTEKKDELVALKTELETKQAELDAKKSSLDNDLAAVASLKKKIEKNNAVLEAQIDAMNAEADALKADILKLQSGGDYTGGVMGWPSRNSNRITDVFGMRLHPILGYWKMHTGIDIGARKETEILCAADGTVIRTASSNGYGNYVMVDHGGGIVTLYAHSCKILCKVGDKVKRGDVLALVGSTGMSTGPHIHFEVRKNGAYQDPLNWVTPGKF
ncbi:MAG: peptidoglycan DD-metalloendopeptidase family protein [Firmicutes bacterium]|nr:peptidoglycan DD-metalloendopeptidase family protein [Bacillota bacterium]